MRETSKMGLDGIPVENGGVDEHVSAGTWGSRRHNSMPAGAMQGMLQVVGRMEVCGGACHVIVLGQSGEICAPFGVLFWWSRVSINYDLLEILVNAPP
jgi:hypothetical protein